MKSQIVNKGQGVQAWIMVKDPLVAIRTGVGICSIEIDSENLVADGPTSSRFVVVDYDTTHDMFAAGTKLAKTGDLRFETGWFRNANHTILR